MSKASKQDAIDKDDLELFERIRKSFKAHEGGGFRVIETWGYRDEHGNKVIVRYNLAYINTDIYDHPEDKRTFGMDNNHNGDLSYHHIHFLDQDRKEYVFEEFEVTMQRFNTICRRIREDFIARGKISTNYQDYDNPYYED